METQGTRSPRPQRSPGARREDGRPGRTEASAPLPPAPDSLRGLARLLLGAGILGLERVARSLPEPEGGERTRRQRGATPPAEPSARVARHAAVGLVLESERQLAQAERTADSLLLGTSRRTRPVVRLLRRGRLARRLSFTLARVEERGRSEVARVVEAGRIEEGRATEVAASALTELTASSVDEVVEVSVGEVIRNPVVREVVRTETASSIDAFLAELQLLTRQADYRVELVVHRLLRRPPPQVGKP